MMIVNKTPVRTSNNYAINDFEIPDEILDCEIKKFDNYSLKNFEDCKIEYKFLENPTKPLSAEIEKDLNISNLNLKININKSISTKRILNINLDRKLVDKIIFEIESGVDAKLIINIKATKNSIHNGFIKFVCKENSCVDVAFVCDFDDALCNLLSLESVAQANAKFNFKFVDFAGQYSVVNFYSQLFENSECIFKNIYVGDKNKKIDLNLFQDILEKNAFAKMETVGALLDEAEKNFKGTISFNKGAKKSRGEEDELCILLSNKARSKALPMLLCAEEDVDGNHSSAIGKVDSKELFYLMSRGLTKQDAIKLLLKAKFNVILNEVDNNLKDFISCKIDRKIENEKL